VVSGREALVLYAYLAQICLLIIASVLLGNRFGMVGIAIAVLASGVLGAAPILTTCMHDFRCNFITWVRGITEGTTDVLLAMLISTAVLFIACPPPVHPTLFDIFWRGLVSALPIALTWRRWRNLFSHGL